MLNHCKQPQPRTFSKEQLIIQGETGSLLRILVTYHKTKQNYDFSNNNISMIVKIHINKLIVLELCKKRMVCQNQVLNPGSLTPLTKIVTTRPHVSHNLGISKIEISNVKECKRCPILLEKHTCSIIIYVCRDDFYL